MKSANLEQVLPRDLPRTQYPNGVGRNRNSLIEAKTGLLSFFPNRRKHAALVRPRVALFKGIEIHVT